MLEELWRLTHRRHRRRDLPHLFLMALGKPSIDLTLKAVDFPGSARLKNLDRHSRPPSFPAGRSSRRAVTRMTRMKMIRRLNFTVSMNQWYDFMRVMRVITIPRPNGGPRL
jgi:hypothetical protein